MKRWLSGRRRKFVLSVGAALVLVGGFYFVREWRVPKSPDELSLTEAGAVGELRVFQLVTRIEKPKPGETGGFERGDVILVAPEGKKWSLAEREGFLIFKARLTEAQTGVLLRPLRQSPGWFDRIFRPSIGPTTVKNRQYAVDLTALDIGPDDEAGRVIEDRMFDDKIIREKE